jgi:hypothetical protein
MTSKGPFHSIKGRVAQAKNLFCTGRHILGECRIPAGYHRERDVRPCPPRWAAVFCGV